MLSVEVRGIDRLRAALRDPQLLGKPLAALFGAAAAFGQRDAQEGARDLGSVPRSIVSEATSLSSRVVVRHPAAFEIEFGRHAGRRQPPAEDLRAWAVAHGLSGAEFAIARGIAKRGIKGRFFLQRTRDRLVHMELPVLVEKAARAIEQHWAGR